MSTNKKQRTNAGFSACEYYNNDAACDASSGHFNALLFSPPPSPARFVDKRKVEAAIPTEDGDISTKSKSYDEILHENGCLKQELEKTKALLAEANNKLLWNASAEASADDDESVVEDDDLVDPWNVKFNQLRQFRKEFGHFRVSQTKEPYKPLGIWVMGLRAKYKKLKSGKKNDLTSDKINKLEGIGFVWGKDHPEPVPWDTRFEELKTHFAVFKDWNMAPSSDLGKWMAWQRSEYRRLRKGLDSILTMEQVELLDGIGFKWKAPR